MKKVLLSLVATLIATMSLAQNGLVASLSHEGNVTYYYGVTAFQQAVAAAKSGDVINLSSGAFNATDVTIPVGITLRGTGIDSENPTYLFSTGSRNSLTIEVPSDDANQFIMEGIRCTIIVATKGEFANPYFVKCQFNTVSNAKENDNVKNIMFVNCKITGNINVGANDTYSFVNCFVNEMCQYEAATATFSNCVIEKAAVSELRQSQFFSCIFVSPSGSNWVLPNTAQATNCICINYPQSIFRDLSVKPNCSVANREDVFKTFTGEYSDEETFELTETAKTTYLGTDGLEIGLYGGLQPYNSTPSYPLITTMNVDKETTPEGKLGVTIEVSK